jgi:hypothetical protein
MLPRLAVVARRLLGLARAEIDHRGAAVSSRVAAVATPGVSRLPEIERIAGRLWRDAGQARVAWARARLRGDVRTMTTAGETLERLAGLARAAIADLYLGRNRGEMAHLPSQPSEALLKLVIACWEPHPVEVMDQAGGGPYRRADLREYCDQSSPLPDGRGDDPQPAPPVGRYLRAVILR